MEKYKYHCGYLIALQLTIQLSSKRIAEKTGRHEKKMFNCSKNYMKMKNNQIKEKFKKMIKDSNKKISCY